jgi:DNA-binding NarL/FixJ family response regulator
MPILIADDHAVYRAGLAAVLRSQDRPGIVEAGSFDEALDRLAEQIFFLALFDLDMPGMAGAKTLRHVRDVYPTMKLAIVSGTTDEATVSEMLAAGIDAYIPKTMTLTQMVRSIGELLERPGSSSASSESSVPRQISLASQSIAITSRQADVLKGIMHGKTNKEIARDLGIAPGTVKIHLAALFDHFGAGNRTQLLARARDLQN